MHIQVDLLPVKKWLTELSTLLNVMSVHSKMHYICALQGTTENYILFAQFIYVIFTNYYNINPLRTSDRYTCTKSVQNPGLILTEKYYYKFSLLNSSIFSIPIGKNVSFKKIVYKRL